MTEKEAKKIPVVEIFGPTIQGEGAMIGIRTSFIRFGLCDYKCVMCDSMHAVDPIRVKENATWATQEEIASELFEVHKLNLAEGPNCEWVTFSGGNPCMHDLTELIKRIRGFDLLGGAAKIAVETQGTLCPAWLHLCDVITVSPKSPGMGEEFELPKFTNFLMQFCHHPGFNVKVVVFSMADIEWSRTINDIMKDWGLGDKMYLSLGNPHPPGMDEILDETANEVGVSRDNLLKLKLLQNYQQLTEDLLQIQDLRNVKFLPQMHVLTWANKQKV
jgi:7-carboxy-7-deazaguanine synthase